MASNSPKRAVTSDSERDLDSWILGEGRVSSMLRPVLKAWPCRKRHLALCRSGSDRLAGMTGTLSADCLTAPAPPGRPAQTESAVCVVRRGLRPGSQTNRSELPRSLWLTENPEPRGGGAFAFSASVYAGSHTPALWARALRRDARERRVTDPTRPVGRTSQTLSFPRPKWFTPESRLGFQT